MALTKSQLKTEIIRVIKSYPWSCTFRDAIGDIWVSPYWLKDVTAALTAGKIEVEVVVPKLMNGAGGRYIPGTNTIRIPNDYRPGIGSDSVLLHESVHAVQDFHKAKYTRPSEDVPTYVAMWLYLRWRVRKANPKATVTPKGGIWTAVDVVARRLEGLADINKRVISLADHDVATLLAAIKKDSLYSSLSGTLVGDGW